VSKQAYPAHYRPGNRNLQIRQIPQISCRKRELDVAAVHRAT